MKGKQLVHVCVMLVFMISMASPAFAGCNCALQGKDETTAAKPMPCHSDAESSKETKNETAPCCERSCGCGCAHIPGVFTLPEPQKEPFDTTYIDYAPLGMMHYAMPVHIPPVSPPIA